MFTSLLLLCAAAAQALQWLALDPRWAVSFDDPYAAPPGYDASSAYLALKTGSLVAVDLNSGTVRWRRDVTTALTPEAGDGRVYVVADGRISALASSTGDVVWQADAPGPAAAPPYWDTGWLLVSTASGELAAYRASDGVLIWRQALGAPLAARPAPALDRLYLPLAAGRLVAVMLASGQIDWERRLPGGITGVRALEDQLIVGTTEDEVHSLDLKRGQQRWRWRVGGDVAGPAAFDERAIYFASRDNVLRAVDRRSGNLRWTSALPSRPIAGPIRHPDAVLVPMATGVLAFNPTDGKLVATIVASGEIGAAPFARFDTSPTAARLIAISRDGQLQGFGLRFEPRPMPFDTLPGAPVVP